MVLLLQVTEYTFSILFFFTTLFNLTTPGSKTLVHQVQAERKYLICPVFFISSATLLSTEKNPQNKTILTHTNVPGLHI